ncbi:gamma-glutamylaminecyclotransferase C-like isoform X2 [Poecilia latipinna]|uniref:gamma-glutamylaminecyclotransferase C-like isoform X2 n=1 Tax=Poecilia formosa TaxID=48698 RepID=UPI0004442685|nr:PREDICTED: gamma-glutamylaminecyclotransferase C-like isoform X2 [Poecilia formosa]XP_014879090.1 PREDICTED: gamma-glutamylaminecyclotransferase C-like isoform X2 [Poecilia latipinna]
MKMWEDRRLQISCFLVDLHFSPPLAHLAEPSVFMHRVFVYGSLKRGQPNYPYMTDRSNGKAEFLGKRVHGEIYKVDEKMLKYLDWFEKVPTMYQRTAVELEVKMVDKMADKEEKLSPGSIMEAFVYSTTTYEPDWPSLPTYDNYDCNGDHGLKFVLREDRK